jgi:RimJ/RimL family protein N-acetyltransferase
MSVEETGIVIDYFHTSTPEHLELLGVDPSRLPDPVRWREYYACEYSLPIDQRKTLLVLWKSDEIPIGFSVADRIIYGQEAYMHLHILTAAQRKAGNGTACVRETIKIYFSTLRLQRLFCEPNAFNIAPNRTLQSAGFKYVKTHNTVPGAINCHQAVTRWVLEKERVPAGRES